MAVKDPKGCLNLKNKWGHSKNPSLEAKTLRPRAKPPEQGKGKRVKTGNRETDRQESPRAKRARSQSPSRTSEREGERTRTGTEDKVTVSGASTPVQTKVKRLKT